MQTLDDILTNLNSTIQVITVIALILYMYWQSQDRKIKGAEFIMPLAKVALIRRLKGDTAHENVPREEALKLRGFFKINLLIMNTGDRTGHIRFKKAYVNSSGRNHELKDKKKLKPYESSISSKTNHNTSLTFSIPEGVWFNKNGSLIIKAEYFDFKESSKPLFFEIPLITALQYE